MTINQLIQQVTKITYNITCGDIPITYNGKEVDLSFSLVNHIDPEIEMHIK